MLHFGACGCGSREMAARMQPIDREGLGNRQLRSASCSPPGLVLGVEEEILDALKRPSRLEVSFGYSLILPCSYIVIMISTNL